MAQPIYSAETIITTAIYSALSSLAPGSRIYWKLAPETAIRPYVIYQPQTAIDEIRFIDKREAECTIAVKAVADSPSVARDTLDDITSGMDNLSYSGYDIATDYLSSPQMPPVDGIWQSIHVWSVRISAQ